MLLGTGEDMTARRAWLALPFVALAATAITFAPSCGGFKERVFLKKGNELYTAQKYDEAIVQYDEMLKINPKSWDGNYLKSVCYLALYHPGSEHPKDKDYAAKGLASFEKTLELTAPSPDVREKTERFYLSFLDSAGDKDKAIAYLEKQLATRPGDLALINQIATMYQKKGDFTKALEYFEKRANMDSNNKETWYTLGVNCWARSYHGAKDKTISQEERDAVIEQGIKALDKALAIDPNYFEALSYINLIYREKSQALTAVGKNAEAGEAYAKADEYQKKAIDLKKSQPAKPKAN
jgi:tetratricopeptide (TPR) repeat protein